MLFIAYSSDPQDTLMSHIKIVLQFILSSVQLNIAIVRDDGLPPKVNGKTNSLPLPSGIILQQ